MRAEREGVSVEETVRRILRTAVVDEEPLGSLIRRIVGKGLDLDLAEARTGHPDRFLYRRLRSGSMILLDTNIDCRKQCGSGRTFA